MGQRRRLGLYAFVIVFRTGVLLMCLNRVQAWVQGEEGKEGRREGRAGGWVEDQGGWMFTLILNCLISNIIPTSLFLLLSSFSPSADESDACWYSGLRHDGRCRERFDFADHGVLFLSQYLAIQTFEVLAVLREVRK